MLRNNLFFFIPIIVLGSISGFFLPSAFGVEIPHVFIEQTTEQTHTGDTLWTDISGATIDSGNFTAGRKYLVFYDSYLAGDNINTGFGIRALHGSTAFDESQRSMEPSQTSYYKIAWFTVWTAVGGEGIKLQFQTETSIQEVKADTISLIAIEISEELTEGTDWDFNHNNTSIELDTNFEDHATITIQSADHDAGDTYLVMAYGQLDDTSGNTQGESRLERTGEATSTEPTLSQESEDNLIDIFLQFHLITFDLGAADNTFTVQGREDGSSTFNLAHSSVFALNLESFVDSAEIFNGTSLPLNTTDWADLINTLTMTPSQTGDVLILSSWVTDYGAASRLAESRMQIDNVDEPTGQTDYLATMASWDSTDFHSHPIATIEDLDTSLHTFDVDGDSPTTAPDQTAVNRQIVAFSMELVGAGGTTFEQDLDDLVTYGDFHNVTLCVGCATLPPLELDDLVTYGDDVSTLLLDEISTNMTDQVTYGDDVRLVIAIPSNMTDQVFYADFVNVTLNVGGAPGGPIIPTPGVTPQGLSLIEWIVYGFFAYGAMLMLMIGIVKEIPGTRTTSLLRIVFILPGIIGAGMLAGPYETIIFPTVDTVNAITLTTENFTETIITTSYIQLQNPVWIIFHYAIMAVMIIYTLSQVLTMLTTAPLEANRNKGNV